MVRFFCMPYEACESVPRDLFGCLCFAQSRDWHKSPTLPDFSLDTPLVEPALILDRKVIHKQKDPIMQVLVQWIHLHLDNNA